MLRFFADECVHADLIAALRAAGYEITTAGQSGLVGADDEAIFEYAKERGLIIVSFDRGFGDIFRFNIKDSAGVIIMLLNRMSRDEIPEILLRFLVVPDRPDLAGKLTIIGKSKIRIINR